LFLRRVLNWDVKKNILLCGGLRFCGIPKKSCPAIILVTRITTFDPISFNVVVIAVRTFPYNDPFRASGRQHFRLYKYTIHFADNCETYFNIAKKKTLGYSSVKLWIQNRWSGISNTFEKYTFRFDGSNSKRIRRGIRRTIIIYKYMHDTSACSVVERHTWHIRGCTHCYEYIIRLFWT